MLAILPAFLLSTSALALPHLAPRGGLLALLPAGLVPAAVTDAGTGLLGNVQAGSYPCSRPRCLLQRIIPSISSSVFGSNVVPGTIQIYNAGQNTVYYLHYNTDSYTKGMYTLTSDRSLADNFTIPVNACGSSATRFGISSTSNRNVDCKTNVLNALWALPSSQVPLVFYVQYSAGVILSRDQTAYNNGLLYSQWMDQNDYFSILTLTFVPDPTPTAGQLAGTLVSKPST
ncbi:hypothetical protein RQP46_007880 [Phenoliferia psychrophenolica]